MVRPFPTRHLAAVLLAALTLPAPATAQRGTGAEWSVYGGDPGHTRYSSLDQIDASNAETLEVAWRWRARNQGPNPLAANQTTPIFVNGMLYATAGMRRNVVAIDPATGETIWTYRIDEGERLEGAPRVNSGRGVSYWSDGNGDDRIYVVTPGYQLVALDAPSGRPIVDFGRDGIVDLQENLRTRDGVPLMGSIGASSPAAVIGDVLVVGAALHVGLRPPSKVNTPGDVRGFDARTGALLWTFHTIPEPGEFGNDTWLEGSSAYTGNAAVWAQISWDAELGYVYLPTEAATGDYYGGHRPGNNLFSTSILTLDAQTGKRVWHFQTIHHDIWDWDNTNAPILADVTIEGRARRIVAQITKQGFVFVLDRVTGEPIWPIEERAVPKGDVPGEWYSPTQPFPTKPAPFERQGFSEADLLDFTPEILTRAREIASQFRWGPLYSPPSLLTASDSTRGTITLPAATGGANWEGGALDPPGDGLSLHPVSDRAVVPRAGGRRYRVRHELHRGRRSRSDRARRSGGEATVGPHHRDRPHHGRSRVDGAERRHARPGRCAAQAAAGEHPEYRTDVARRPAGDAHLAVRG